MKIILVQIELQEHLTGETILPDKHTIEDEKRFKMKKNKTLTTIALGEDFQAKVAGKDFCLELNDYTQMI